MNEAVEQLKKRVLEAIMTSQDEVREIAESIYREPELGYKEFKTSAKVKAQFEKMGIEFTEGWGVTGLKARIKGRSSKRTIAVVGELDAIVCREHPFADKVTGAAHCCGHNVQIANMLLVGWALVKSGVMNELDGDVVLFAVPAEEYVEIDYRKKLIDEGKIRYLGGKQEIIAEGGFDDVDMAMMMHVEVAKNEKGHMNLGGTCNGFIGKLIEYRGRAAHAAAAPDEGVNALNACMMGVMGVNAIRETFKEADYVRFHPIINAGGDLVNVIPDRVAMESYTRCANVEGLVKYNKAVNRALRAGAMALGAECEIKDLPGYLPMRPNKMMRDILGENSGLFAQVVYENEHSAGSTDMGDVSHLIPTIHPYIGCVRGTIHGANYDPYEKDVAYVQTPYALAATVVDLLVDGARKAEEVVADFKPVFTKETYIQFLEDVKKEA